MIPLLVCSAFVVLALLCCGFWGLVDLLDFRREVIRQLYPHGKPWGGVTIMMVQTELTRLQCLAAADRYRENKEPSR